MVLRNQRVLSGKAPSLVPSSVAGSGRTDWQSVQFAIMFSISLSILSHQQYPRARDLVLVMPKYEVWYEAHPEHVFVALQERKPEYLLTSIPVEVRIRVGLFRTDPWGLPPDHASILGSRSSSSYHRPFLASVHLRLVVMFRCNLVQRLPTSLRQWNPRQGICICMIRRTPKTNFVIEWL